MGAETKIEWAHHTFNPWWGCQRVSPGCEKCYAEAFSKRLGGSPWGKGEHWGPDSLRTPASAKQWSEPRRWNMSAERAGERHRVFCASMADVFEDRPGLAVLRARLYKLIRETPHLDWLLLTKRPQNADRLWAQANVDAFDGSESIGPVWGPNVWLGTTIEDRARADARLPILLATKARVRFVSYEPALELVDFGPVLATKNLHWLIIGGESGPGARPFNIQWAKAAIEACRRNDVAPFFKQAGDSPYSCICDYKLPPDIEIKDCRGEHPGCLKIKRGLLGPKGGDLGRLKAEMRVREFPVPL